MQEYIFSSDRDLRQILPVLCCLVPIVCFGLVFIAHMLSFIVKNPVKFFQQIIVSAITTAIIVAIILLFKEAVRNILPEKLDDFNGWVGLICLYVPIGLVCIGFILVSLILILDRLPEHIMVAVITVIAIAIIGALIVGGHYALTEPVLEGGKTLAQGVLEAGVGLVIVGIIAILLGGGTTTVIIIIIIKK